MFVSIYTIFSKLQASEEMFVQQVTKDSKDKEKDAVKGDDSKGKQEEKEADNRHPTPEIQTLLEFVAWLVWQKSLEIPEAAEILMSKASANWMKGRGGFLAEELMTVRDASIRLQVPTFWSLHPVQCIDLSIWWGFYL